MQRLFTHIAPLFIVLCMACEEASEWNFQSEDRNRLIVDAIITNERKQQEILLNRSYPELNGEAEAVTGADVMVSDSLQEYIFTEVISQPGVYRSDTFQAVVGRNYQLSIRVQNNNHLAYAAAVPVHPNNPIFYSEVPDSAGMYRYQYAGNNQASMTVVDYNWEHNYAYCQSYGNCLAREIYYTLWYHDINEIFGPETDYVRFPIGTQIIQKKYSLSDEHQYFLRSLLMETQWSGGVFDVQHGNVPSNISNDARGFFAVCMVVTDSIRVE